MTGAQGLENWRQQYLPPPEGERTWPATWDQDRGLGQSDHGQEGAGSGWMGMEWVSLKSGSPGRGGRYEWQKVENCPFSDKEHRGNHICLCKAVKPDISLPAWKTNKIVFRDDLWRGRKHKRKAGHPGDPSNWAPTRDARADALPRVLNLQIGPLDSWAGLPGSTWLDSCSRWNPCSQGDSSHPPRVFDKAHYSDKPCGPLQPWFSKQALRWLRPSPQGLVISQHISVGKVTAPGAGGVFFLSLSLWNSIFLHFPAPNSYKECHSRFPTPSSWKLRLVSFFQASISGNFALPLLKEMEMRRHFLFI